MSVPGYSAPPETAAQHDAVPSAHAALRYTAAATLLAAVCLAAWQLAPLPDGGRNLSLSLLLGAAFGIVLQRSRFCFYCIARDAIERLSLIHI